MASAGRARAGAVGAGGGANAQMVFHQGVQGWELGFKVFSIFRVFRGFRDLGL